MKKILLIGILFVIVITMGLSDGKTFGIHGGAGTDIHLGIAVGGGASYLLTEIVGFDMEIAAFLFYSYSVDNYREGALSFEYTETTSMFIFAVLADVLFNYTPEQMNVFFIAGGGAMGVSVDWQIRSTDDPTANDDSDGVTGGLLINLGLGWTFGGGFEIRIQTPVFLVFAPYQTLIAPMFVAMAGYRF